MRNIPTTQEIHEALSNDFKSNFNITDDELKKNFDALTGVLAAQFRLLYLYLGDIQNNVFPDTADTAENGGTLERLGNIYLNRGLNPATVGVFSVSVTGTAGAVIRQGLGFKSNDTSKNPGQTYITSTEYTLTGSNDVIQIRSVSGGAQFDLDIGDTLTLQEPVLGVNNTVQVTQVDTQPIAEEDIDTYRRLIIEAIQLEPQGGARSDYRIWSADAEGVRTVYPYVSDNNAGSVLVYVEANPEDSVENNPGVPSDAIIEDVEEVIEQDPDISKPLNERGRRPIQATVSVDAVTIIPVDVTINGITETSAEIEASVRNSLTAELFTVRPYIAGADLVRDRKDVLTLTSLQSVVLDTLESGNVFTTMTMDVNGNTTTSFTFDGGNIPYLRNLTINL